MRYEVTIGEKVYQLEIERTQNPESPENCYTTAWNVRLDGRQISPSFLRVGPNSLSLIIDGQSFEARVNRSAENLAVFLHGRSYECIIRDPRAFSRKRSSAHDSGEQKITASMPGKVVRVLAQAGEPIQAGQGILVIEAMKMQNEVRAPKSGMLKTIVAKQGANVNAGEVLATIE
jgi:biotin carboxyl carrier protein